MDDGATCSSLGGATGALDFSKCCFETFKGSTGSGALGGNSSFGFSAGVVAASRTGRSGSAVLRSGSALAGSFSFGAWIDVTRSLGFSVGLFARTSKTGAAFVACTIFGSGTNLSRIGKSFNPG